MAAAAMLLASSAYAQTDCGKDQFFEPRDVEQKAPLVKPHADFERTRRLAMQGVAAEERNLAAFYDTGYMVTMCREKARYWYSRAAQRGDEHALEWLARHEALERLRAGPECFDGGCFGNAGGPQKLVVFMRPNGMFFANGSINGKPIEGLIDTGATFVSMGTKTAQQLGISYENGKPIRTSTANGVANKKLVMLEAVTVGPITLQNVEAAVGETDQHLLIGMSFLRRLTVSTNGNAMTLSRP